MRDNSTRIVLVSYTDLQFSVPLWIESRALIALSKSYKKDIAKALDFETNKKKKPVSFTNGSKSTWNTILEVNKKIFPGRSWYREWKELCSNDELTKESTSSQPTNS